MTDNSLTIPRIPVLGALREPDAIINALDESGVRRHIDCLNWPEQYPYRPLATFAAAHSGMDLWIDFLVRCNFLRAENSIDQSPVSEDSCVEVFLQPRDGGEYWNFEFNCIGTANASHRLERPHPIRLTPQELARIERYPSCGRRPFCEVEGLFTWNLLVKIPLDLMGVDASAGPVDMRGNFYKCASRCSQPHFMSWEPVHTAKPDFHRPEFFGDITLA